MPKFHNWPENTETAPTKPYKEVKAFTVAVANLSNPKEEVQPHE